MNIEQLTGQVMADKTAAAIYASLDAHIPPNILADNYLESKLSGNTAECLALELFARQLTMRYCHIPEVINMLSAIERYKKMKKPGKGGARIHRDIADAIDQLYADGMYTVEDDGRLLFFVFTGGKPGDGVRPHIKIRCKATKAAVMLLSAKYRRGMPKSRSGRYGTQNN
jgi:hypothetical protein